MGRARRLFPARPVELTECDLRERAALPNAVLYSREPVALRECLPVPVRTRQEQLKVLATTSGRTRDRLVVLCRLAAAVEEVEGGYMVVPAHALVERFTEIGPIGLTLFGSGKLFHNSSELTT